MLMPSTAFPLHQLRGHVAREDAASALPTVRGVILPTETSTGGAVTAAGGFLDVTNGEYVAGHVTGIIPAPAARSAEETTADLTSPGTGAER